MGRLTAIIVSGVSALGMLATLAAPAHGQAAGAVTAFEGARIITGDGRAPIENGILIVEGSRIVQVGSTADVRVPSGARRVNLAGKTIMPAIVDTHVHTSQTREELTLDLRRRAFFGVSAALSLGQDTGEAPFELRNAPLPGAARIFTAGRGITSPEPGRSTAPYWVTTEAEARKAVAENAAKKVDIIKVWVDDRNGMYQKLSPQLYGAVIDEAHRNRLRVTAHLFELADAKALLRAGVDAFAHGVRDRDVDDEFMGLVRQRRDLVLCPNLPSRGVRTDLSWLQAHLPAAEFQRLEAANTDQSQAQAAFGIQARNLARMSEAGVRIVLGSDGNTPWGPHLEMEDMVAAGMTPMQVIVAATRNGAEFLGMRDAGTLEAGKRADFIVLDANPLERIANTRRIAAVYLQGAAVDRARYP